MPAAKDGDDRADFNPTFEEIVAERNREIAELNRRAVKRIVGAVVDRLTRAPTRVIGRGGNGP
jgi:hypothetical protein